MRAYDLEIVIPMSFKDYAFGLIASDRHDNVSHLIGWTKNISKNFFQMSFSISSQASEGTFSKVSLYFHWYFSFRHACIDRRYRQGLCI